MNISAWTQLFIKYNLISSFTNDMKQVAQFSTEQWELYWQLDSYLAFICVACFLFFVAQRESATLPFSEDFYLRKSVRAYGKEGVKIYPGSGYKSYPDKPSLSNAVSYSVEGIDLNDQFKFLPDDSVERRKASQGSSQVIW